MRIIHSTHFTGTSRVQSFQRRQDDRCTMFSGYSFFAWGISGVLVGIVILMDQLPDEMVTKDYLRPSVGIK